MIIIKAWLLIAIINLCFAKCPNCDSIKFVNETLENLEPWYTPYDNCVLKTGDKKKCLKLDQSCSATIEYDILPSLLYTIPVFNGKKLQRLNMTEMMLKLNESRKVLVFIGDSITRDSIMALFCRIFSENNRATMNPPVSKIKFGAVDYQIFIPLLNGTGFTVRVGFVSVWRPVKCSYDINYYMGGLNYTVWNHPTDTNKNDAVVIFNAGLHQHVL